MKSLGNRLATGVLLASLLLPVGCASTQTRYSPGSFNPAQKEQFQQPQYPLENDFGQRHPTLKKIGKTSWETLKGVGYVTLELASVAQYFWL